MALARYRIIRTLTLANDGHGGVKEVPTYELVDTFTDYDEAVKRLGAIQAHAPVATAYILVDHEEQMRIANTILEQLGGSKFTAMTGARNFSAVRNGLLFAIPGGRGFAKSGINVIQIDLDPNDTYTVTFSRLRAGKRTEISKHSDIYAENLCELFERETGLRTSL